jgi:hypothetical protein
MLPRRAFIAGGAALACAGWSSPARAFVDTATGGGAPRSSAEQARTILDAVTVITATQLAVRTVWRAPAPFPPLAPIACYVARGHDPDYPDDAVIWLNVDHPELKSPRAARLTDEIPLLTELLLASADVRPRGTPSLGLESLDSIKRRSTASMLAGKVAVVARYSPYATVSEAEFARLAFPYAVLRQMTPGIEGVARVITRASDMPREDPYAAYVGRGAVRVVTPGTFDSAAGKQALVRAYVFATADAQPAESAVKRAYQAARAEDAAHGDHWAARHAFAAPYVTQVTALLGE